MGTRWRLEFDAIDPFNPDEAVWKVGVEHALLESIQRYKHEAKQMALIAADFVFKNTDAIYRGWDRPNTTENFVYTGFPPTVRRKSGVEVPADKRMIFAVFVRENGNVASWDWRKKSGTDLRRPDGIEGEAIWRA